jgi:HlyD family secretion protein
VHKGKTIVQKTPLRVIKHNHIKRYSLVIVALHLVVINIFLFFKKNSKNSVDKYLTVTIEGGEIPQIVSSTGPLQAIVIMQVGIQVWGGVQDIYADFNTVFTSGQSLAVNVPANFEAQREKADAQLATAQATIKNSDANLLNRRTQQQRVKANLEVSKVNLKEAERQKTRAEGFFKDV